MPRTPTAKKKKPRRTSEDAELEVAIVGEGITPRSVPLRETIAVLEALASLLEITANEMGLPVPNAALTEVRLGSAAYELPFDEAKSGVAVARGALDMARARGAGSKPTIRRALDRLHKATKVGAIRLGLTGVRKVVPFLLAAPTEEDEPEIEEATEIRGFVCGVVAVRDEYKISIRADRRSRIEEFTARDSIVAEDAAALFNKSAVVARVTYLRSESETRPGAIEGVDRDEGEEDLLSVLGEVRRELTARGVEVDASPFLGGEDGSSDSDR